MSSVTTRTFASVNSLRRASSNNVRSTDALISSLVEIWAKNRIPSHSDLIGHRFVRSRFYDIHRKMRSVSLQSGSNGNCIYVESKDVKLLFDAGISGVRAASRLSERGLDISKVDAVIISHNHWDHVACAGVYHRKFGLPVHVTTGSFEAAVQYRDLGKFRHVNHFEPGDTLDFGNVQVETIATPHDGVDGVAFVAQSGNKRLGVLTDLGHAFSGLAEIIGTLDAVFLESNYDPDMLHCGPYPPFLKKRITGKGGHLSNLEAAELIRGHGRNLKWACLAHLSEQNNTHEVALSTHKNILGNSLPLSIASRHCAGEILNV